MKLNETLFSLMQQSERYKNFEENVAAIRHSIQNKDSVAFFSHILHNDPILPFRMDAKDALTKITAELLGDACPDMLSFYVSYSQASISMSYEEGISYEYKDKTDSSRVFTSTPHAIAMLDFAKQELLIYDLKDEYQTALVWAKENAERLETKLGELLGQIQKLEKGRKSRLRMLAAFADVTWTMTPLNWLKFHLKCLLVPRARKELTKLYEREIDRKKVLASDLSEKIAKRKALSFETAYQVVEKHQALVIEKFSPLGFDVKTVTVSDE